MSMLISRAPEPDVEPGTQVEGIVQYQGTQDQNVVGQYEAVYVDGDGQRGWRVTARGVAPFLAPSLDEAETTLFQVFSEQVYLSAHAA